MRPQTPRNTPSNKFMSLPLVSKGIEHLTSEQRALVEEYLTEAKIHGVVTGVLIGAESWDLRPLILESGRLEVLRPLPFETLGSPVLDKTIAALERATAKFDKSFFPSELRRTNTHAWLRRLYPHQVLAEAVNPFAVHGLEVEAAVVLRLLEAFSALFKEGVVHGNVSLSNIGYVNGNLIPLDICYHAVTNANASAVDDLERLGKIFSLFKFLGCSPALVSDLNAIGVPNSEPITTLERLIAKLSAPRSEPRREAPPAEESTAPPVSVARGKIVDARVKGRERPRPKVEEIEEPVEELAPEEFLLESPENAVLGARRARMMLMGLLFGFAAIAVYVLSQSNSITFHRSPAEYAALWNSNQPEQLKEIIGEALDDPFSDALEVIRKETFAGRTPENVRSEIIKVAFDPQWFGALSETDRRTVLSFALGDLVPSSQRRIAPFAQLHPGVLLALAGMVSIDNAGEMFAGIQLGKFLTLPKPIADSFQVFIDAGITELRDLAPRAYAHLFLGDGTLQVFEKYFIKGKDLEFSRKQMRAIQPVLVRFPAYAKGLADYLTRSDLALATQYDWFEAEQAARWADAPALVRLSLLSGVLPPAELSLEQYIDLLQFPLHEVRKATQDVLIRRFISENYRSLLFVLTSDENKLSRSQMIFLVSALQLPDEEAFAFFARWFNGEPDPDTVFLILLARSRSHKAAPFDIEAARYLIDRQWSASVEELAELVYHPEPLARALAYSRLDPKKPGDLQVLKAQLERESSERMREQIREKLGLTRH